MSEIGRGDRAAVEGRLDGTLIPVPDRDEGAVLDQDPSAFNTPAMHRRWPPARPEHDRWRVQLASAGHPFRVTALVRAGAADLTAGTTHAG
ncbi:hypothetical protein OG601_40715 [Streptomyces sp. NBC_01239]|uniref:hypothetical protein n=1 Tax=Streptomyces sp. NBC_01239 TaxID=2903792 RepID=UPI002257A353|nr:hypothetical protein [Streptomyces sp. NBC_01239]MCX4816920.1 hypothetical protein [Streptomyces sp. NBC_01239]